MLEERSSRRSQRRLWTPLCCRLLLGDKQLTAVVATAVLQAPVSGRVSPIFVGSRGLHPPVPGRCEPLSAAAGERRRWWGHTFTLSSGMVISSAVHVHIAATSPRPAASRPPGFSASLQPDGRYSTGSQENNPPNTAGGDPQGPGHSSPTSMQQTATWGVSTPKVDSDW
jgi:hypothetical protein